MVNFPYSLDDDTTLYVAVNNKRTELSADIDNSQTNIPVLTTSGFPSTGFITILSDPTDVTQAEAITYSSTVESPPAFTADQRGAGGTTAVAHSSGDNVDLTVVAAHHNELKDAIIALEYFVGVSGSENFVRLVSGDAVIAGHLTLNSISAETMTASGTISSDTSNVTTSLTISGTPVLAGDPLAIGTLNASTSLTISGSPVHAGSSITLEVLNATTGVTVSGLPVLTSVEFPQKGTKSFTTSSIAGGGGSATSTETGFANRALVRKLVVTPSNPSLMISTTIELFKKNTFVEADLEYQATASGTFTDNDTWFHEDEDGGSGLHWKVTNDSATAGTYDFELIQEEFA